MGFVRPSSGNGICGRTDKGGREYTRLLFRTRYEEESSTICTADYALALTHGAEDFSLRSK